MLETVLYVKSMDKATEFYASIFGLEPILSTPALTALAMDAARSHVLLLFQLGLTNQRQIDDTVPGNEIPPHGPTDRALEVLMDGGRESLRQHFCFAVESVEDVKAWAQWLEAKGVAVDGHMDRGQRGYSIYFSDLDGHAGEVASRRLWEAPREVASESADGEWFK